MWSALFVVVGVGGACEWPARWSEASRLDAPERVALVVRGMAFRDCGHGVVCDAAGDEVTMACASSQMNNFVKPLHDLGWSVDVLVASYECPGRTPAWLAAYGEVARSDLSPAQLAVNESQLDSLLRALRLIDRTYAGVLLTRADLFFLSNLAGLVGESRMMFHADMSGGARYAGRPAGFEVLSNTDKLFWIPGPLLPCFLDAVDKGECFANYDDDDVAWISGERCFPAMRRRLDRAALGFLRDDTCEPTRNGTFGDNERGDGCYLVLPRALAGASPQERHELLRGYPLGPYLRGECRKSKWAAASPQIRRAELRR